MRIAILSDIHGNFIAFDTVLADVKRAGADQLVCLGDVAFNGSQSVQVLKRLKEIGCPIVKGNADDFLLDPDSFTATNDRDKKIKDLGAWTLSQLSKTDLDFVRTFQPRFEIPLEDGKSLLCYRASPLSNEHIFWATTPDDELVKMLGDYRATVMAGGHTHMQMLRRFGESTLINPGSIGMPVVRDSQFQATRHPDWAEYAMLTCERGNLSIEFRRVPLDVDAIVRDAHASGMPHVDWWVEDWLK